MRTTPQPVRVLVADDHFLIRKGLCAILEDTPGIQVVGEAQNGAEVQQLVPQLHPHVLLLDLVMPETQPLEVATWVHDHYPDTTILVLTGYDRRDYLTDMVEIGVAGYIIKGTTDETIIVDAIWSAVRGESLITQGQIARIYDWQKGVGERWQSLTNRESQVLRLMAQGLDNASIAEMLCVSVNTVRGHVSHIYSKLKVADRTEALAFVLQHKLLDLET